MPLIIFRQFFSFVRFACNCCSLLLTLVYSNHNSIFGSSTNGCWFIMRNSVRHHHEPQIGSSLDGFVALLQLRAINDHKSETEWLFIVLLLCYKVVFIDHFVCWGRRVISQICCHDLDQQILRPSIFLWPWPAKTGGMGYKKLAGRKS